jgi:hypothetical protein
MRLFGWIKVRVHRLLARWHCQCGRRYWSAGRLGAARRALEKSCAHDPRDYLAQLWLGHLCRVEGDEDGAAAAWSRAASVDPGRFSRETLPTLRQPWTPPVPEPLLLLYGSDLRESAAANTREVGDFSSVEELERFEGLEPIQREDAASVPWDRFFDREHPGER